MCSRKAIRGNLYFKFNIRTNLQFARNELLDEAMTRLRMNVQMLAFLITVKTHWINTKVKSTVARARDL